MKIVLPIVLFTVLISCTKDKQPQSEIDETVILEYIADEGLDAKSTDSGLYFTIDEEGTGEKPNISSTVTVVYKGYLPDGYVFDQSTADGLTIPLANVIQGWQEGIPLLKEGGSGVLLIPSGLGYGSQGSGDIPKNSVIIFDVELLEVE